MKFVIAPRENGGYDVDSVQTDPPQPTKREVLDAHRAERAEARKSAATRVVESHQALDITPPMDVRAIVEDEGRTPCPDCGFMAATEFGLKAHMRAKHKVNGTDSQ